VSNSEESEVVFEYRGRALKVTFVVDEDGLQLEEVKDFNCTSAEAEAFERGEWFFHHLSVEPLDADGTELTLSDLDIAEWFTGVPTCRDQNDAIYQLCDKVCDELDHYDFPLSLSGYYVDWNGDTRKFVQRGEKYSCMLDVECKRVDVFNREGLSIFEGSFYHTLEEIAAAGIVVNLIK
jgi:hypothetical protein